MIYVDLLRGINSALLIYPPPCNFHYPRLSPCYYSLFYNGNTFDSPSDPT
jgi:hypothetical protein